MAFKKSCSFSTLGLCLTLLFALVAELYRFHGILLLDLFVPLFVATWLCLKWLRKEPLKLPTTMLPAVLFIGIGVASLLIHSTTMTGGNLLDSAFYAVRWISFFGLSLIVFNQSESERSFTWKAIVAFTVALCLAGFLQLIFVPNFTAFETLGWDPHQGRLLSTWFDPNLLGGFLAFMAPLLLGTLCTASRSDGAIPRVPTLTRAWTFAALAIVLISIALTLSRSSTVALLVGLLVFGLFRSFKWLVLGALVLALAGMSVSSVRDRFLTLVDSVQSVTSQTYTLPDESARLRYQAWENGWDLFLDQPLIGQGYNRYKFAALEKGLIKDPNVHSASGSDSSILSVLATTGIAGFLPFLSLYILLFLTAWKQRKNSFGLGAFSGLCGLAVHSIFVNSLLFPLFMAPFWITMGLLQTNHGAAESPKLDR